MEDDKKNKKPILYHGRTPLTRREFLASGAIPFVARMAGPSLMSLFARAGVAEAADFCKATGGGLAPIVNINLSGGAALAAQWIPLNEGRQLLSSYSKIGLGSGANLANAMTREFKNKAPFWSGSGLLTGLQTSLVPGLSAEANANTHFVGLCLRSANDSDANKFSIAGLVDKVGLKGNILPPLGRFDNGVGVSNSIAYTAGTPPLIVNNVDNIANALGVADRLATLNAGQKANLFKTVTNLSNSQARKVASQTGGSVLSFLLNSANSSNSALIENPSALNIDPMSNPGFSQVWGLTANTSKADNNYVNAALIFNAINGNAGSIGIEMGGYDYHGNDRNTVTTPKDNAAGVLIGKIIQSFHTMKTKGFIYVNSDGGVGASASDIPGASFTADRAEAGAAYMIAYDPIGTVTSTDSQLGHMLNSADAEAADESFLVGGSPEVAAAAIFANYLSFNGVLGKFSTLPETSRVFDTAALDKIVKLYGKG